MLTYEKLKFISIIALSILCLFCNKQTEKGIRITIITQAMDSEFWQKVKQGAEDAAEEFADQQVNIVEDQILKRVSAIAVSPCGATEIIPMLDKAHSKSIPVIIFNSDIEWEKKLSFIGTDNYLGGKLAGQYIIKALKDTGKVAVIRGIIGIRGHEERVGGFLEEIKTEPGIEIVSIQPANSERELALTVMENILTLHPDLDAVFMTNDGMALGALEAIDAHRLANEIVTVGFDGSREAIQAVKDGRLTAEVVQNPYNIGRQTLMTAYRVIKGEIIKKRIDTGTLIIDKTNVHQIYKLNNEMIEKN